MRFFSLALVYQSGVHLTPVGGMNPILPASWAGGARAGITNFIEDADERPTPLCEAVRRGNLDVISNLLQQGATVDFHAFSEACYRGNAEMVDFLIDHGADVNEGDRHGVSFPLSHAIRGDRADVVELLIRRGATQGITDGLKHASRNFDIIQLLLENGANPNISCGRNGNTPLFNAVLDNRPDVVRILLDHGADLRPNFWGRYPIEFALKRTRIGVIDAFVEDGIIFDFEIPPSLSPEVQNRLILGGASNTGNADDVLARLMAPITAIKSAVATLPETDALEAFGQIDEVLQFSGFKVYTRCESLIAFAFEARKNGINVFGENPIRDRSVNTWTQERFRMVSSIITALVYLECSDVNFFYTVSPFLAEADEDMLRHAETAFKFLAGSLAEMPQSAVSEEKRATRGAILNEMIARSNHHGLRPVVKALFAIYHEEWQIMRTFRLWGLPRALSDLVINQDHGPSNPGFKAKAMRKLMQAIRRLGY